MGVYFYLRSSLMKHPWNSQIYKIYHRIHVRIADLKLEPTIDWSAHNLICIMAAAFVLKTNCRNFSRFNLLISRKLYWYNTAVKCNNTISLRASLLGQFQKMAGFSSKSSSSLDLSGIFPPIVTPFEDNEEISYGKLTENFSKWNDIPFRGRRVFISMIEEIEIRSLID